MVVVDRDQDAYVLSIAEAGGDPARALIYVKEAFAEPGSELKVPPADVAALTKLETSGAVTATQAKTILADIVANGGGDAAAIAKAKGFEAMDDSAFAAMIDEVIADNGPAWAKYCSGEDKALGALVGAAMKASKGQADGKLVTAMLQAKRG